MGCSAHLLLALVTFAVSIAHSHGQDQTLLFDGLLLDDSGKPVNDASVQFWQADMNGYYNHPLDSERGTAIPGFQYFGTAATEEDGSFFFKTYKPGLYPGRPAHIHFKVWVDGNNIFTSQFYFEGENGGNPAALTLQLEEVDDPTSEIPVFRTSKTVGINRGGGGDYPITPQQAAGPYYPRIDFFHYDNDITVLTDGEEPLDAGEGSEGAVTLEDFSGKCGSKRCNPVTEFCCNESCGTCAPFGESCDTENCSHDDDVPCGANKCNSVTEYCCNESCGICAPVGGSCTAQFCDSSHEQHAEEDSEEGPEPVDEDPGDSKSSTNSDQADSEEGQDSVAAAAAGAALASVADMESSAATASLKVGTIALFVVALFHL